MKLIVAMTVTQTNSPLAAQVGSKEHCGDGPFPKCRKVLEEIVKVTSTSRSSRTLQHAFAIYEQTKKNLSFLYPKRRNQPDGIDTHQHSK